MRQISTYIVGSTTLALSLIWIGEAFAATPTARMAVPQVTEASTGNVVMLIVYVALALIFSFLCSIAEAVLLSVTPSYIQSLKSKRPKRAALLKRLKQDYIDRSLAAILTLNTIAHTVGAIGAGAEATAVFGSAWFGLFSAVMTLAILFLSEIVPKTIGALYWAKLTSPVASFVRFLIIALYPVVWISEGITKLIAGDKNVHVFSREEFVAMALVGQEAGLLGPKESRIIQSLFRFKSLRVTDIMTPRTVIMALPERTTIETALATVAAAPFSRLPVYGADVDDVTGFVLKDDILIRSAQGGRDETLESLKRKILGVPESISLSILLERFLAEKQHIARVVDEYGGTRGLVTLEDLVETLMGLEIVDETDDAEDMRALAREQWVRRAEALGVKIDVDDER